MGKIQYTSKNSLTFFHFQTHNHAKTFYFGIYAITKYENIGSMAKPIKKFFSSKNNKMGKFVRKALS